MCNNPYDFYYVYLVLGYLNQRSYWLKYQRYCNFGIRIKFLFCTILTMTISLFILRIFLTYNILNFCRGEYSFISSEKSSDHLRNTVLSEVSTYRPNFAELFKRTLIGDHNRRKDEWYYGSICPQTPLQLLYGPFRNSKGAESFSKDVRAEVPSI